ncbi:SusC/RagA family TonB-linked outer membrane protein [Solitalea canadensis]|uniref:TonB-linked outer membrane protein, SusC/RagA family n=1 Tax=Solitalea canadensis (strain ATCC 29591 / DSM 3403 / JCM 21819 / LMG 8368 / NBRC 15130 / NCIMB 12057 / USAM 9D) TaxID=929556 RepID=H8KRV1_SOLCM|nr:TonB-dependent receptor [Solitalea canadensis]AFD07739.1 TonB-linked outer membrane protein, SusC/RagA family [Solitalea canadensis DSM 3403]
MKQIFTRKRKLVGLMLLLFSLICQVQFVSAQTRIISGTITDKEDGMPLPGVTVIVKGSSASTVTDANGKYSIRLPESGTTLLFTFVGFKAREVKLGSGNIYNIAMEIDSKELGEVVVVGYGKQKKENLTGALTAIKGEELLTRPVTSATAALQGIAPGVTVQQGSGQPGADGGNIRIRGQSSMFSKTFPLILVDGVESNMDDVDMNTVESISILKDAASASIYGSRAANGVVLITTKRGKQGLNVGFSSYYSVQNPTELPTPVSAVDYMRAVNQAKVNNKENPQYSQALIDQYINEGADNMTRFDTDWRSLVVQKNVPLQNYALTINGGSDNITYFASGNYMKQKGLINNNSYERFNLRLNTDVKFNKWVKSTFDVNVKQGNSVEPGLSSPKTIFNKALNFVPVFSGVNNDGTWGYGQNGDNPAAIVAASGAKEKNSPDVTFNGTLFVNPVKGLELQGNFAKRVFTANTSTFIAPYDTYENGTFRSTYPGDAIGSESFNRIVRNLYRVQASYNTAIDKHNIKVMAGGQAEDNTIKYTTAGRSKYYFPGFEDLNNGEGSTASNSGGQSEWAMASLYGRANYDYKGRYLLELNARYDGSSRFGSDNRWGFYPSASVGWRVSDEPFMEFTKKYVDNIKLRASYGELGNQDLTFNGVESFYPYTSLLIADPQYSYWFDKQLSSGFAPTELSNPIISWERSTQLDIGLDADFFNGKLTFTGDYYVRKIERSLQKLKIPIYVGLDPSWQNLGSMENKGWEIAIGHNNRINEFKYGVTLSLSDVKNKIDNLNGQVYDFGSTIHKEGEPYGAYYGYIAEGYFQTQEEINASPVYGNRAVVKPGFVKYRDISGPNGVPDGVIDSRDRVILGNPFPRYEYGLNLTSEYKGFDLTVFVQGVGKKDTYIAGMGVRPFFTGGTIYTNQLDTWTPENPNAEYPLLLINEASTPNYQASSKWIKDGSYMRLKNIVVGYTLPAALTNRVKVSKLRFYVSGQNLFTLSNFYKGYDPEISVSGNYGGEFYPIMKTITLGLDAKF